MSNRMYLKRLVVACALVPMVGFAYQGPQNVPVLNNQESAITLGSDDYNRLFVEGDRILQVRGDDGAYNVETDNVFGQVYIKPTSLNPFELYITTETGKTYALAVHVVSGKREDVGLVPKDAQETKAARFENNTPYQQAIVALLRAMANGEPLEGFDVSQMKGKAIPLGNVATMTQIGSYQGDSLVGEVYTLQNISSQVLTIKPEQLYRTNTAAIAMQSENIPVKSSVRVFIVQNEDSDSDGGGDVNP